MASVLIVTKTRTGGGTEKHIAEISQALGVEVAYTEDGFWTLYHRIYINRYDIVHFFLPRPYLLGSLACDLAFQHNRIMSRRSLTDSYQKPWIRLIEQLLHTRTRILVGNSPAVVKQLLEEAPKADIRLIRNGIKVVPYPRRKSVEFTIITVANDFPYKGYLDLFAAIKMAGPKLPEPWRWVLIGRGTEKYGGWRIIALEYQDNDEVLRWLSVADLFVLPSHEEGSSNALLEAMACGVPAIATDVGGNKDTKAYLVSPRNPTALAEAIVMLANDVDSRTELARLALKDVKSRFSFERCVNEYKALYSSAA